MEQSRIPKPLKGQLELFTDQSDGSFEYVARTDVVTLAMHRLESGDDTYLLFPTDSLEKIAFLENYSDYHTGAREIVTSAAKNRFKGGSSEDLAEFMSRKPEIMQNVGAAHVNSNQGLRRKIAQNVRDYDMPALFDTNRDVQELPARLRNARKDGALAHFTFAQDARTREDIAEQLKGLAGLLDRRLDKSNVNHPSIKNAIDSALKAESSDTEAARLLFTMGQYWSKRAEFMHEIWTSALERYNKQFPSNPIDPHDPQYSLTNKKP